MNIVRSLAITLTTFVACSESTTDGNPDKPAGELARCAPRAPAIEGETFPSIALPTGACPNDGERCALQIGYACAGGGIGRTDQAQCTCREAKWVCAVTGSGTSTCPTVSDASSD